MIYIKINNTLFPAMIDGKMVDHDWDNRDSKAITLEMDHATALKTFVNDLDWSIICHGDSYTDPRNGETVTPEHEIYDNSDYCVAGSITDNRNGTITVKMGKKTDSEMLSELLEVLNND